jgi:hypothetical protein
MKNITEFLSNQVQGVIALLIILCGFAFLIWAHCPETINGRVEDLMFLVGTFYFGSSKSGSTKDATISSLAQNQQTPLIANSENTTVKS